jgi:hypothetical protein
MSEMSEKARAAAKDKAERLTRSDPHARVDASGYSPEGAMDANAKTGLRPLSRRQFRRGGKVDGNVPAPRADRKRRASGGAALTPTSLINRDVKTANEERTGTRHIGGFAKGGRAEAMQARVHKLIGGALTPQQRLAMTARPRVGMMPRPMMRADGGKVHADAAQDRELIHEMGCKCGKCSGGRAGRREGGKVGDFAGGGPKGKKGFPMNDPKHQRMAISGATRSYDAGNISKSKEESIKAEARHKLGIKKARGGPAINDGTRPTGGRLARKGGGRAKKGTNVNIIIAPQGAGAAAPPVPRPMPVPPGGPVGLHQGAPPVMPPAGVPPAALQGNTMPMRARGGVVADGKLAKPGAYPIDAGAGGGLGRLEKAERAARS